MRVAIVGGGIIGLATARTVIAADPSAEVVVLEREAAIARHQTGHNSGVVHAGIYYAPGSLKARLCRRGMALLREFCAERGIPYEACGKLVVATDERERRRLEALAERAAANEVPGLAWLEGGAMRAVEPHVGGLAALHSPASAIVDFAAVARELAAAVEAGGGSVRLGAGVARVREGGATAMVELTSGETLAAERVIVCAGLESDRLARASGQPAEPRIVPFRGEYLKLRQERTDLVRGLIYPVPDPALPFLGVHLTRRIDGAVLLGPNAVLALALAGYRRRDVSARDLRHILGWPGTWRMMRRHWRAGLAELRAARRKELFVRGVRRFVPELSPGDTVPGPAGVRAQAVDRDGTLVDDFRIGRGRNVLWVRNAPSPAATSSLAIAEELVAMVDR
ncbi:MAG TPA: L-2-hydroxyglutarate oxidase [Solirubrobacterales bacterium]|nr:L-2-hydroxyglutarate oxidase [Solirubrobacterales bacterium]